MKFIKEKNIRFSTMTPALVEIAPPVPAAQMIPDWFKKLPLDLARPQDKPFPKLGGILKNLNSHTVKKCPAIVDYFAEGFVIPLWCDILIQRHDQTFHFETNIPDDSMGTIIEFHNNQQLETYPFQRNDYKDAVKFTSPWFFWTPPGWSTLFLQPQLHPNNDYTLLPGIVETDSFHQVNFPSIWHAEGDRLLKQGTPFLHVIPFKREKIGMETSIFDDDDNAAMRDESFTLRSKMTGGYRNITRKKK